MRVRPDVGDARRVASGYGEDIAKDLRTQSFRLGLTGVDGESGFGDLPMAAGCVLPDGFFARGGARYCFALLVFLRLRVRVSGGPRRGCTCFAFAVALLFGCFCSFPGSAISRWRARVAPVRGGTYFSLQRQRKVGKRKPLTPTRLTPTRGLPTFRALGCAVGTQRMRPLRARGQKNKDWRCEPAFFAYFLCGGKESKSRPGQGQRLRREALTRMPATPQ